MSGTRRRAAQVLLAWMAAGVVFAAGAGHTDANPAPPPPCHAAGPPDGGDAGGSPAPRRDIPCQWVLPLFCCQQPAAADAAGAGWAPPAPVILRALAPRIAAPTALRRAAATALRAPYDPLPDRSVILLI